MSAASAPARHVAEHLGIRLSEYDDRIRTFIPHYEEILDAAASAVGRRARRVVDLGIGTGALSSRVLTQARGAAIVGIDEDEAILGLAARRLGPRAALRCASFLSVPFPAADAFVASFALHHVRTRATRLALYRRVRRALRRGGVFVAGDCYPATDRALAAAQMQAWRSHVRRTYSPARTTSLFLSWAREDTYVPLATETALLENAGFRVDVVWRRDAFAVLAAR
jgi:tRNA (cmo5U34)-methyltransferase